MQPLRSNPITGPSTLLRTAPPLCLASVLRLLRGRRLSRSLSIEATGSHVPYQSLYLVHAISMPVAAQAINRFPLSLSWGITSPQFRRRLMLSTPQRWFACTRLLRTYLTHLCAFSLTLTTTALYRCSSRWFGTRACTPIPRDLPSSSIQHCAGDSRLRAFVTH